MKTALSHSSTRETQSSLMNYSHTSCFILLTYCNFSMQSFTLLNRWYHFVNIIFRPPKNITLRVALRRRQKQKPDTFSGAEQNVQQSYTCQGVGNVGRFYCRFNIQNRKKRARKEDDCSCCPTLRPTTSKQDSSSIYTIYARDQRLSGA